VLIALVMISLSLRLIQRSHDSLVGAWAGAAIRAGGPRCCWLHPAAPASRGRESTSFSLGYPGVTAIRQLLVTFIGPGRVRIVARVDIDDGLRGAQAKSLVSGIESGMKELRKGAAYLRMVAVQGVG
jgi:hypothetical protein